MPLRFFALPLLLLIPGLANAQQPAQACVIRSVDDLPAITLCQQNVSIPPSLFESAFCQPQIPEREFEVEMGESCPAGAYGICEQARNPGVGYQQSIHYYSDPDDAPVLSAYCEQISSGRWVPGDASEQR